MSDSMISLIQNGGPVIWLLSTLSVIAVAVCLFKCFSFWQYRENPRQSVDAARQLMQAGKHSEALIRVQGQTAPRAKVLARLIQLQDRQITNSALRDEGIRLARLLLDKLNSGLKILEVIATTAPLIGLFGTVLGMIEAFQAMESAGRAVNPAVLSGGIWQALLTTAAGMAIAIPVTMIHSAFQQHVYKQTLLIQDDIDVVLSLQTLHNVSANKPESTQG